MTMKTLKGAILGTGFWANYQIPAWQELDGVEIVAAYNRTKSKAEAIARKFGIPSVYDNAEEMIKSEKLDFVDIITDVDTHAHFTELAVKHGVAVICQKPMAPKLEIAKGMLDISNKAGVPFYIHENFRWQKPIRTFGELLKQNIIGNVFKAKVTFCSAFPVFDNQPFLAELDEFILTDVGSHVLDACRFLFGEAEYLTCHISTVNKTIKGEDVANVFMRMKNGISCYAEMSYASILEKEAFPQTFILAEGSEGSLHLGWDYQIKLNTRKGTETIVAEPKMYPWADPQYAIVHSSIVDCNRNILAALQGTSQAETTGEDNFETVRLVHASYASARNNTTIKLSSFE
jgi:D-apiose dehydrogenase